MSTLADMSSLSLLLWITLALVLQAALFLAVQFARHWKQWQALREAAPQAAELVAAAADTVAPVSPSAAAPGKSGWSGFRSMRVERKVIEDAAQSVCSFYLRPTDAAPLPPFLPGQFLTFRLNAGQAGGDEAPLTRCYSLSDAPGEEFYRVSIKRVPAPPDSDFAPGRSSNHFHDHVNVGDELQVRAPSGHFYLQAGAEPVVLVAGGIGLTPMLSMLNWSLRQQPQRVLHLYYGVRNCSEVVMKAHLDALAAQHENFHFWLCCSDPAPGETAGRDFHHHGRVSVDLFRLHLPLQPHHFYICGPGPMMASIVNGLDAWGVADQYIHFEAFGPASIKRPAKQGMQRGGAGQAAASDALGHAASTAAPGAAAAAAASAVSHEAAPTVTFAVSGKTLTWDEDAANLLEFAEANAIAIDSGCRAGGCGACQTVIRSGEATYLQTPDFDPEPGACLPCVCKPKSDLVVEL